MKHLFVSYDLSLQLKEKGFDEPCFGRWEYFDIVNRLGVKLEQTNTSSQDAFSWQICSAPLYQQVTDWFEINHNLEIIPMHRDVDATIQGWTFMLIDFKNKINYTFQKEFDWLNGGIGKGNGMVYSTKYEAFNSAINEALKLI